MTQRRFHEVEIAFDVSVKKVAANLAGDSFGDWFRSRRQVLQATTGFVASASSRDDAPLASLRETLDRLQHPLLLTFVRQTSKTSTQIFDGVVRIGRFGQHTIDRRIRENKFQ